jgi:hypothetical protein
MDSLPDRNQGCLHAKMNGLRYLLAAAISVASWPVLMVLGAIAAVTAGLSMVLVWVPRAIRPNE